MDHGWHKLSENIWFVWSKRSYSGDKKGCHARGRTDEQRRTTECEDRARILETEFAISVRCEEKWNISATDERKWNPIFEAEAFLESKGM